MQLFLIDLVYDNLNVSSPHLTSTAIVVLHRGFPQDRKSDLKANR